jgi:hypothetical protein
MKPVQNRSCFKIEMYDENREISVLKISVNYFHSNFSKQDINYYEERHLSVFLAKKIDLQFNENHLWFMNKILI